MVLVKLGREVWTGIYWKNKALWYWWKREVTRLCMVDAMMMVTLRKQ